MLSAIILFCHGLHLAGGVVGENTSKVPSIESNVTNDDVTETQYATCKIVTEELVADARATVTKVLTGSCSAKAVGEKFERLEEKLIERLEEIKSLLYTALEEKKDLSECGKWKNLKNTSTANFNRKPLTETNVSPRQYEIDRFNGTIQEISSVKGPKRAFTYYWQVNDFDVKLANWNSTHSLRSPTFYVEPSYAMYIRVTPKYFPDGTIFAGVGLTRGQYDSYLKWPFPLEIRLEILDQSSGISRDDRRSRVWDPSTLCSEYFWGRPKLTGEPDNPECVGLSVSRQVILSRLSPFDYYRRNTRYLWNGSLIIKLTIYS